MDALPEINESEDKKQIRNEEDEMCKEKRPTFWQGLSFYFYQFSNSTGIHGFKYMGERNRALIERLFWIIFFGISLNICIMLIVKAWIKWDTYPVLVSFARSPTPIYEIPFPAITICSETKVRQRVYNFTNAYHRFGERKDFDELSLEDSIKFSRIALVCDRHLFHKGENFTKVETIQFLKDIAPPFEEMFFECSWMAKDVNCRDFFTPVLTEEGICFTFNALERSEFYNSQNIDKGSKSVEHRKSSNWNLKEGYTGKSGRDPYPRRTLSSGANAGIFLTLRAYRQDLDYLCRGPIMGFRILLHHPAEVPKIGAQYFRAPLNQEIIVSVKPDMMTTSDGLVNYEPHRRQCFFQSERQLHFYKTYTQRNCQQECLTNFTLKRCDCVAYHMPHKNATNVCGSGRIQCMYNARQELLMRQVDKEISNFYSDEDDYNEVPPDCDCLPSCTSISYNAEFSQAEYDWHKYYTGLKQEIENSTGLTLTKIGIFFKEMQFITSERNELNGVSDFLANCGGLLGLFTGFSFLTLIEIVYFLTLRLFCNVRKFGKYYWSGYSKTVVD